MNEKQTSPTDTVRPTKKQRELLDYIERFIAEHGYSPSYREIMSGLQYTSIATVALHIKSLIERGHLRKRDFSARSLELTHPSTQPVIGTNAVQPTEEKWLIDKIEYLLTKAEQSSPETCEKDLANVQTLLDALQVLGLTAAAQGLQPRLSSLKTHQSALSG